MKIVKVSSEVFDALWFKTRLQQQEWVGVPHPCIVLPHLDTLVVLDQNLSVSEFAPSGPVNIAAQFTAWVRAQA